MDENKDFKKHWKEMTVGQKLQYFRDYYLIITLVAAAVLGTVIFLIWNFTKPQEKDVLNVAFLDETLDSTAKEELISSLNSEFGADGKLEAVVLNDNFNTAADGLTRLAVYVSAHSVDAVVADRDVFTSMAASGYFTDLSTVLTSEDMAKWEPDLIKTAGYDDSELSDAAYDGTGKGAVLAYGMDFSKSTAYKNISTKLDNPVFAIVTGGPNPENTLRFLEIMMS